MESHSLEIEYQKNGSTFKVVLTSGAADIFARAAQQKDIRNKKEEALVAALIAFITSPASKSLLVVDRYKDGQRQDGEDGAPAMQSFGADGKTVVKKYFSAGRLNDTPEGEPAMQAFDDRGRLIYAASHKKGDLVKILSSEERDDYQFRVAQKNAGRPAPDKAKPHSPKGGMKLG
jgi:hypothetical protein